MKLSKNHQNQTHPVPPGNLSPAFRCHSHPRLAQDVHGEGFGLLPCWEGEGLVGATGALTWRLCGGVGPDGLEVYAGSSGWLTGQTILDKVFGSKIQKCHWQCWPIQLRCERKILLSKDSLSKFTNHCCRIPVLSMTIPEKTLGQVWSQVSTWMIPCLLSCLPIADGEKRVGLVLHCVFDKYTYNYSK
jgi:hypothetical protein